LGGPREKALTEAAAEQEQLKPGDLVKRHRLSTRLWHWTNALSLLVLFMSGLMIFNAYPRLHWGHIGSSHDSAWLEIGGDESRGYLKIGSTEITTTGVFGRWRNADGELRNRAFPYWMTIPSRFSLPVARNWHLVHGPRVVQWPCEKRPAHPPPRMVTAPYLARHQGSRASALSDRRKRLRI
jgi:Prokaryotic cytochrome b561